jgi:ATP-binding protein involved in chromosome partitioning
MYGDLGMPYALVSQDCRKDDGVGGEQWIEKMSVAAQSVRDVLGVIT